MWIRSVYSGERSMPAAAALEKDTRARILTVGREIMARRGFSAVGLTEILSTARVPKGSFYHYFESKDAFGVALLESYFDGYAAEITGLFETPGLTIAEKLMVYFANWRGHQNAYEYQGRCLAVKLGAEVSDLSEPMRMALKTGTDRIISHISAAIEAGSKEGSIRIDGSAGDVAATLYHHWLGASVMVKILRDQEPFEAALRITRHLLGMVRH
jgi:TetR/AcrR family transcriptional repressor of nem operon